MSTSKLSEPTDRELDAAVAEKVMGIAWDEKRCRVCGWPIVLEDNPGPGCWVTNCSLRPPPDRRADEPAYYSTDRNAAGLVLERIGELGLQRRFINILWHEKTVWELLTATPRQLCEVAFACVEKEPNAPK